MERKVNKTLEDIRGAILEIESIQKLMYRY